MYQSSFQDIDIPLFQALIQDLFPEVKIPDTKHAELNSEIDLQFVEMHIKNLENLV